MGILNNTLDLFFCVQLYANTKYTLSDFAVTHETEEGEI